VECKVFKNLNFSGNEIAIGNSEGNVEIWDVENKKLSRMLQGHNARVGVCAWNCNNNILSTGK
jgi:WD40 repeat protein